MRLVQFPLKFSVQRNTLVQLDTVKMLNFRKTQMSRRWLAFASVACKPPNIDSVKPCSHIPTPKF